jgi:hypothetical protein
MRVCMCVCVCACGAVTKKLNEGLTSEFSLCKSSIKFTA